jgi:hypothetical protein
MGEDVPYTSYLSQKRSFIKNNFCNDLNLCKGLKTPPMKKILARTLGPTHANICVYFSHVDLCNYQSMRTLHTQDLRGDRWSTPKAQVIFKNIGFFSF